MRDIPTYQENVVIPSLACIVLSTRRSQLHISYEILTLPYIAHSLIWPWNAGRACKAYTALIIRPLTDSDRTSDVWAIYKAHRLQAILFEINIRVYYNTCYLWTFVNLLREQWLKQGCPHSTDKCRRMSKDGQRRSARLATSSVYEEGRTGLKAQWPTPQP